MKQINKTFYMITDSTRSLLKTYIMPLAGFLFNVLRVNSHNKIQPEYPNMTPNLHLCECMSLFAFERC